MNTPSSSGLSVEVLLQVTNEKIRTCAFTLRLFVHVYVK